MNELAQEQALLLHKQLVAELYLEAKPNDEPLVLAAASGTGNGTGDMQHRAAHNSSVNEALLVSQVSLQEYSWH